MIQKLLDVAGVAGEAGVEGCCCCKEMEGQNKGFVGNYFENDTSETPKAV